MTRIVRNPVALAACFLPRLLLAVLVAMLLAATADAALTTSACLVQKRKAWITFRKCQGTAQVNQIKGKLADLAKCQTTFQSALTKIDDKATKAEIGCRYRDNGDGTITDFDTGLMWEKKIDQAFGLACELSNLPSCWTRKFTWATAMAEFISELNGFTLSASSQFGHAGHTDWRLPTIVELQTILMHPYPCGTSPCIDPIFGPTVADFYWSATTVADSPNSAWSVGFNIGNVGYNGKNGNLYVRAVRAGL